ncbi:MAG TPA: hypothetical protein PLW79_00275 [Caldisericia bacterium]|nr:hypothetical protein [Caldisericia bacterium]HPP42978.1 hypothetical protein [Caldisericia bacterium]
MDLIKAGKIIIIKERIIDLYVRYLIYLKNIINPITTEKMEANNTKPASISFEFFIRISYLGSILSDKNSIDAFINSKDKTNNIVKSKIIIFIIPTLNLNPKYKTRIAKETCILKFLCVK